jgi:GDP-L-fucose synthase
MESIDKNDCIVITGGSGFLGTVVTKALKEEGYTYVCPLNRALYDLVKHEEVEDMFGRFLPSVVIHLAATVGGIGANQEQPGRFFYENAMMGIQVIEQARIWGVKKIIVVGTVCSYPKYTEVPFVEESLHFGYPEETNAAYGYAKRALLVQLQAYWQQYNLNSVYLLLANMYGLNDNFNVKTSHVIPAMIRKFHEAYIIGEKEVKLWGTGKATRDFLHVTDAARAIVLALQTEFPLPDPINIGTGVETSIEDLAQMLSEMMRYKGAFVWDQSKPDGQPRRCLNIQYAQKCLGFVPQISLEEGLNELVAWYKKTFSY